MKFIIFLDEFPRNYQLQKALFYALISFLNIYKSKRELGQEKKQLQRDLLSLSNGTIDLYVKEFDALKSIIQCPLSIRKSGNLGLRRLIISNIFNNSLAYSDGEGLRTNEIPLVYAQNPDFEEKLKHFIKTPLRTADSPVGNLYNGISNPLVDAQRDKYNNLIEKLKSKSRLLRFMIKRDNIDISLFI